MADLIDDVPSPSRRHAILLGLGASLAPIVGWAQSEAIEIGWADLMPEEEGTTMQELRALGVIQHGQLSTPFDQETGGIVTDEFNGMRVRMPGYMLPLDYVGTGVTSFILVPFVGACIHVPPPPPNQLVFVTTSTPYESQGLFEPIHVTGVFGTSATGTELAMIGYEMSADLVEPFSG